MGDRMTGKVQGRSLSITKEYIEGLKNAYMGFGLSDGWNNFESIIHGADEERLYKIKLVYPDAPNSLLEMLEFVDGTYHRRYGNKTVSFYFLGSDVYEYPYYLLSANEICKNQNIALECYSDYIERVFDGIEVDDKISDQPKEIKWLHFSDCMNNGGSSQLFIDFTPSEFGKKGQIVRFLHDPDELIVIADSFEEYLKTLMENKYNFINEDTLD